MEAILMTAFDHIPNDATLAAMHEAEINDNLEVLDLDNFDAYVKSLN